MLLALIYFVRRLLPHIHTINELLEGRSMAGYFLLSTAIYSIALIVLSSLWTLLLTMSGANIERNRVSHALVYLLTIVAKYLPGNVFQYATRHILTKKLGLPHKIVALAAVAELAILSATAVLLSIIVIMAVVGTSNFASALPWSGWDRLITPAWISLVLITIIGISIVAAYFLVAGSVWQKFKRVATAYFTAGLFFSISFISLWIVAQLFLDVDAEYPVSLVACLFIGNIMAWLTGMVTPGAPGGLGVREVVFLALLSPFIGEPQALGIAVASRLTTLSADGLVSFITYIATKKNPLFVP